MRSAELAPPDRIVSKIQVDENGCWLWQGSKDPSGYGRLGRHYAHRYSYETFVDAIPDGLQIDHLCRVRRCVNPEHLEPVTCKENIRRSPIHPSNRGRARTHCKEGHELTPENTYSPGGGSRRCLICNRAACRRYYAKRKRRAD